jgi:hypothetical protein
VLALREVDAEDVGAHFAVRQVHEEDLVEAALAQQLRRQRGDVVGGGDEEHAVARSLIHVRSVPSTRRDTPPSPAASPVATPFSISSSHRMHGTICAAVSSASRRLRSVSPWNLL